MTKIFAHRGFSSNYPENTMLAFQKAVEAGSDGIELDVHVCKSGEVVIIHDNSLIRTTDSQGMIEEMTLTEIKKADASAAFAGKYGFNPIPTLEEYLDFIQHTDIITNIEIKSGKNSENKIEEKVIKLIHKYNISNKIIISSFDHYCILECKRIDPKVSCGFLVGECILEPGAYTKRYGVEFIHPRYSNLNDSIINEIHSNGIGINVWTVDNPEDMTKFINKNVNAIITNRPNELKKILN